MKNFFSIVAVGAIFLLPHANAYALDQPTYTPMVIDLKGKPRDVPHATITITDTEPSNHTVYGFDTMLGTPASTTSAYSASMLEWLRYPHTLAMKGAGTQNLDLSVPIPPDALPGTYHAEIRFASDNFQGDAQKTAEGREPIILTLEVQDPGVELVQLSGFSATKNFFPATPAQFQFALENTGTKVTTVAGSVRIYDKTGTELKEIAVPELTLGVGDKKTQEATWDGPASIGRYKAFLTLNYGGDTGDHSITDTAFFWILDIQKIIIIFGGGLFIIVLLTYVLHKRQTRG